MKEKPILMCGEMVRATLADLKTQTRRVVKDYDFFGCFTGDCPHETQADCDRAILDWAQAESPYGVRGDRLWVKETFFAANNWRHTPLFAVAPDYIYRADNAYREDEERVSGCSKVIGCHPWKPSIFMPRTASRINLEVRGIRVERVQNISPAEAVAEGVEKLGHRWRDYQRKNHTVENAWFSYMTLWNAINLKPKPYYEKAASGQKVIAGYLSYPWCREDFEAAYPGVLWAGQYRGKLIQVVPNPWVWVIEFRRL